MAEISEVGNKTWIYRAAPSNIPYLAIYILNLGQAIIAVFLSSEFIKRDRKQDTTEVFYVRSMSNATYVLGKAWSILSVFLLVNVLALTLSLVFNSLASDSYIDWQAFLYYPLLISVPTLVFIIGLSSLMMSIIRNQALTFVILIGYILSSLIYLKSSFNYLFDYMAFHMPMFHSQIIGFGNWETILTLRAMYTCFGLGFIFTSILILKRLRQSAFGNYSSVLLALAFTGTGIYLAYQHIDRYKKSIERPTKMIALNNEHLSFAQIDISEHQISLIQKSDKIEVEAEIRGKTTQGAQEFVFNLNPGLSIEALSEKNRNVKFERKEQLVLVKFDSLVQEGVEINLQIQYSGSIDEDAMFIDIDPKVKIKRNMDYIYDIGRKYAYHHPDFLLLPPEAHWYLQSGVTYSSESPVWFRKDFIDYKLKVETLPGLTPVSTGKKTELNSNSYSFDPGFALPQLSLSIGNYVKKSLTVDSIEFAIFHISDHDYFQNALLDIRDTIPSLVIETLRDYERKVGLKYPFETFSIVEVPGQFKSYDRTWKSIHETNQVALVYFPEKGLVSRRNDFNGQVKRQKRWGNNKSKTPEELQIMVFNQFLNEFYSFKDTDVRSNPRGTRVEETINPYYQFVQFYEMTNNLDSKEWPVINRIFESYLRGSEDQGRDWVRRSAGSTQNELANMVLQEKSFAEVLNLKENRELIDNVIELKGETLFSIMEAKSNSDQFRTFIGEVLEESRFENLPFEEFNQRLEDKFGIDVSDQMNDWFNKVQLSKYSITTPIAEKVQAANREMVRVRFKVTNDGLNEGVVKISLSPGETRERLLFLDPGQTKEASYLTAEDPSSILFNTLSSGNLPNQIEFNFEQISKSNVKNAEESESVVETPTASVSDGELIFDNESSEFEFNEYEEVSRLRKWLKPETNEDFKYKGTRVWRPPLNWTATTNDEFYGEFIRSAFYIKSGDGSKLAKWKIPISEPGRYDVYYHVFKDESLNWNRGVRGSYQFSIPHQNGTDRPTIEINKNSQPGWTALGDYTFSSDTITIALSNETKLRAIFADAIKLVKMD